jgi:hypothetical protein
LIVFHLSSYFFNDVMMMMMMMIAHLESIAPSGNVPAIKSPQTTT